MAHMPEAAWRPIPENATQPHITPRQVILHSVVGSHSPRDFFDRKGVVVESHFWVALDGRIDQYLDTEVQADANLDANKRAISVETADNGNPDGFRWTDAQIRSLVAIIKWAHAVHRIPIQRCEAWDTPGIGYHSMWGAPSHWTPVSGKTCPGKARIPQFQDIINRARQEHDDMPLTAAEKTEIIEGTVKALLSHPLNTGFRADGTYHEGDPQPVPISKVLATVFGAAVQLINGLSPDHDGRHEDKDAA